MDLTEALKRYKAEAFTDDDITRCTGLSVRAWRELIKVGAVRKISDRRGPGHKRTVESSTFKRAAMIDALNRAGFSLATAGRLAYFLPLDDLLYTIWDPWFVLVEQMAEPTPETGLPPFRDPPKVKWFDPDTPAKAEPDDWRIEVYEGRFVGLFVGAKKNKPTIYGDLRQAGTQFVSWYPFHEHSAVSGATEEIARALLPYKIGDPYSKWEHPAPLPDRLDPKFLDYVFEDHSAKDDLLAALADDVAKSPLFKTSVNITLAIRRALRRYLGIDPAIKQNLESQP